MLGIKTEIDPKDTIRLIKTLFRKGFTEREFREAHHLGDSSNGFIRHCEKVQRFRHGGKNHQLHEHLGKELKSRL